MPCPYCQSTAAMDAFEAREMMFGRRTVFEYGICKDCFSCVLLTPLTEFCLAEYYPKDYYSFGARPVPVASVLKRYLLGCRLRYELGMPSLLGAVVHTLKPGPGHIWKRYGLRSDSTVLDVGCGSGGWLFELAGYGLDELFGCDPFLLKPIIEDNVKIYPLSITQMSGEYDMICFNHSFEHVPDPRSDLLAARGLQRVGGRCIIRSPTTSSEAFDYYHENWVQLDPPRHLTIPSRDGMRKLAGACGYRLAEMIDDSTDFQFCGSEQYLRDIPLNAPSSIWSGKGVFTAEEREQFSQRATQLNRIQRGDQTAFILEAT